MILMTLFRYKSATHWVKARRLHGRVDTEAVNGISVSFLCGNHAMFYRCAKIKLITSMHETEQGKYKVSSQPFWKAVFNKRACHHPIFNPSFFFVHVQMVSQLRN
jgi:hypothetical protein